MNATTTPITTTPVPETCPGCTPADFASNQEVRWCPGCGDYSILAQTRKILARTNMQRHNVVFVSGIGCSSRFPYYMNTYGFHSIHGRAPTIATGLKLARPDLQVWIATGDGDALSIGGNHILHTIRRNVDVKILLFNNRIYGLTKGQYSPTSDRGTRTKTSPMGSLEEPLRPMSFALGCGATFCARTLAVDVKHMEYVLERAAHHKGTALVEVYQNCVIFNDGTFNYATEKDLRPENVLYLEHGKPLLFGDKKQKGIALDGLQPRIVDAASANVLVHDERDPTGALAFALGQLKQPDFPEPVGVFRAVDHDTFDALTHEQIALAKQKQGVGRLQEILDGGQTWDVA